MSFAPVSPSARPRVNRGVLALAAGALAVGLGGCTSGFEAQTNAQYDPGVGTNEAFGDIAVLGVVIVQNGEGNGTLSATLTRRIDQDVALTGVTAVGDEGAEVEVAFGEPVPIPINTLGDPLLLSNLEEPVILSGEPVSAGRFVDLTFEFSNGQSVDIGAPVVERSETSELYAEVPEGDGLLVE